MQHLLRRHQLSDHVTSCLAPAPARKKSVGRPSRPARQKCRGAGQLSGLARSARPASGEARSQPAGLALEPSTCAGVWFTSLRVAEAQAHAPCPAASPRAPRVRVPAARGPPRARPRGIFPQIRIETCMLSLPPPFNILGVKNRAGNRKKGLK